MKHVLIAITVLAFGVLACMESIATPTVAPSPSAAPSASPVPATATPAPSEAATAEDVRQTTVKTPVVYIHKTAGGEVRTDVWLTAGQQVVVLEIDGDWVQIENPAGWVYIGCLDNLSEKGCVAK